MQRYYISGFQPLQHIQIDEVEIIHHCYKVLRLNSEDFICIFNGVEYCDYIYKIIEISKDAIKLEQDKIITKNKKKISSDSLSSSPK